MKMKKLLVLSALAVVSAAFVACSSDDDLVQQAPVVPEENLEKGTPFSVMPYGGATRATLFNSNAWDGTNDTYVNCFKLYGAQGTAEPWVNDVVFTRLSKSAAWVAERDADGAVASLTWPKDDTETPLVKESEVATNFYAITDNDIKGQSDNNALTGVSSWMSTEGSFDYTLQSTTVTIPWINTNIPGYLTNDITDTNDDDYMADPDITIVDPAKMRDLMYATTTMTEADVTDGELPLPFHHALAGLSINAKFLSTADKGANGWAKVKAVTICGLKTSGTFTMNPVNTDDPVDQSKGGKGAWSGQGTYVNYHYEIPIADQEQLYAQAEDVETPHTITLVPKGEWLVVPQTTTPWDKSYNSDLLPDPKNGAYIILRVDEYKNDGFEIFLIFPLDTSFNAGKNRVITVDVAQGREYFSETGGVCDLHFEPSQAGGSRQLDMAGEEF